MKLNHVTVGCTDYAASVQFYRLLGLRQIVDSPPRYARFETPNGETLSIHAVKDMGPQTTTIYFEVDDVDRTISEIQFAGLVISSPPNSEEWLWREARLHDPAGNEICIYRAGDNRRFPPWRMEDEGW